VMLLNVLVDIEVAAYAVAFLALLAKVVLMVRAGVSRRVWLRGLGWLIAGVVIAFAALYEKQSLQVAAGLFALCLVASSLGLTVRVNVKRLPERHA